MLQKTSRKLLQCLFLVGILWGCLYVTQPSPAAESHRIYLPLIPLPPSKSIFGIEMFRVNSTRGLDLMLTSGTRWVRRNALTWKEVEPVEGGGYKWDSPSIQMLEQEMIVTSQNNLNMILIIRGSPEWAVSPYSVDCAPINASKYAAYGRFLKAVVERYSKPPYNVKYWELGNEPDAPVLPANAVYGCWGQEKDPYFGGEAYGAMLKYVAPIMKSANPNIQILNGGLMLAIPYEDGKPDTYHGRFFEGMLKAGAGNSFDILSFHGYTFYLTPNQSPLGAYQDWRVPYLRDLMKRYNVPEKPMIRTEAALLCTKVDAECRWAQADTVARYYIRSMRDKLLANIWYIYDSDSYHNTALIEPGHVFRPRQAYFAYRHAATLLQRATYDFQISGVPSQVEAYQLKQDDGTKIVVYWTDSPGSYAFTIQVPSSAAVKCTDRDGNPFTCSNSAGRVALTAVQGPQYVVIK